jgi:hypothetical protein
VLRGEDPIEVAQRWDTQDGAVVEPVVRDDERLARIREAQTAVAGSSFLSGTPV